MKRYGVSGCLAVLAVAVLALAACSSGASVGMDQLGNEIDSAIEPDVGGQDADVPGVEGGTKDNVVEPKDVPAEEESLADGVIGCEGPGEYLCPCVENKDCVSGYCVESAQGKVCTMHCIEDCPLGWLCLQDQLALPDVIYVCLPQDVYACKPCMDDKECHSPYANTGDMCVPHGDNGSFCAINCKDTGKCPEEYVCAEVTVGDKVAQQCVPADGECDCKPKFVDEGAWTECVKSNGYGTCFGKRFCTDEGLTKCDATNPKPEECNDIDDNCDDKIDPPNSLKCLMWYMDNDGDGYGIGAGDCLCEPVDNKQVNMPGDCDDANTGVNPAVEEACNHFDDNCDGTVDESHAEGCQTMYADADNDGFGDPTQPDCNCWETDGWTKDSSDCDDKDPLANPGAEEMCDGKDNDCDNVVDEESAVGCIPYYLDQDKDTYGLSDQLKCLCEKIGDYTATKGGDCDDTEYNVHPTVVELCDGLDNDCDGELDEGEAVASCGIVAHGQVACSGGCIIGQCDGGFADLNLAFADGCECQVEEGEVPGQNCNNATPVGDLPDSGSAVSQTGRIVPQGDEDWYVFQAIDTSDKEDCDTFHIRVRLVKNPGDAYMFDVYQGGCAGADNVCVNTTLFEFATDYFLATGVEGEPGGECKCKPDANHSITPPDEVNHIPFDGDDTNADAHQCKNQTAMYYVRVFRDPNAAIVACDEYQIEFSNGINQQ